MRKQFINLFSLLQSTVLWWIIFGSALVLATLYGLLFQHATRTGFIALGVFWLFILPGFCLSFLVLPERRADWLLRLGISLVIGLSIEPILVFFLGRIGMPITLPMAFLVATGIAVVGLFAASFSTRQ